MQWSNSPSYIVSTDLDGTLLDHHTYDWHAALPAIERLASLNVPIIFNTSKTFSEVQDLQSGTGLYGPAVVENGSALYLPKSDFDEAFCNFQGVTYVELDDYWQIIFGKNKKNVKDFINNWRDIHGNVLEGYSDWSIEKIMQVTDLPYEKASLSASKVFSEPFIWKGEQEKFETLQEDAAKHELQILQGGRFYHLQGMCDKGQPLLWLKNRFVDLFSLEKADAPKLICLGDNKNDIKMLNIADYPVCVKSPVAPYPQLETTQNIIQTEGYGPVGWNEAINSILEQH